MPDDDFISTAEAGELLGVHKKTIKRRTDSYLKSKNISLESATRVIDVREVNGKRKYFVSKEFVLKHLVQEGDSSSKSNNKDGSFATKQLLRQLEVKDLQLTKKDEQIAAKDGQIGELNERLKESHVLVQKAQQLHGRALQSKRPLLSFGSVKNQDIEEEGSLVDTDTNSRSLRRVIYASAIGFTALATSGSLIYYFL